MITIGDHHHQDWQASCPIPPADFHTFLIVIQMNHLWSLESIDKFEMLIIQELACIIV
jgi:hypothetical protein